MQVRRTCKDCLQVQCPHTLHQGWGLTIWAWASTIATSAPRRASQTATAASSLTTSAPRSPTVPRAVNSALAHGSRNVWGMLIVTGWTVAHPLKLAANTSGKSRVKRGV